MVKHDGGVLRAPVHVSLPGMRTRTVVTLYSVDLARPIVLMACSEPRNWFTALARHNGPQVVTITLVDDLLSEYGGRIARHVLTKPSDLLFFAGPCTGGSSWARLNKTRGIDTAEKIEAKQREFWRLFERFVEIKRHAMTKRAAILFELPGSCDYWKDERLREVVHDGISHEFDGCRYGLKQRYAKKPMPIKKPWRVVSWNFDLGSSLSKKCNGNHEHGPCAGRETRETQLYTSLIVGVILRRFRARAKCLQPAPLKLALACITRGRSRKHQATACDIRTTPTVSLRSWASPEPLVSTGSWASPEPQVLTRSRASPSPRSEAGLLLGLFCGIIRSCLFWVFPVLENIIKMTANTTVVNTNEFFCVPVGKSRQAAIFLGNLVKNAIEEGKRIPKRMEMGSDLGMCIKWIEDIGVPAIYAYSAYYSAKCRGMMKGEGQSMRVALEFLSKVFGQLSADECMLGWREFCSKGKKIVAALNQLCGEASLLAKNPELLNVTKYCIEGADMLRSITDIWDLASGVAEDNEERSFKAAFHQDTQVGEVYKEFISDEPTRTSSSRRWRSSEEFQTTAEFERHDRRISKFRDRNWGKVFTLSVIKPPKLDFYGRGAKDDYQKNWDLGLIYQNELRASMKNLAYALRRDEEANQHNLLRWMICGSTPSDISDACIGAINSLMCVSFIMRRLQPLLGERHARDQSYTAYFRQDKNELKELYREVEFARNFLWCIDMIYESKLPAMNINSISLAPHAADRAAENQDRRKWVSWLKEIEKKAEKDVMIDFYQNNYCTIHEVERELERYPEDFAIGEEPTWWVIGSSKTEPPRRTERQQKSASSSGQRSQTSGGPVPQQGASSGGSHGGPIGEATIRDMMIQKKSFLVLDWPLRAVNAKGSTKTFQMMVNEQGWTKTEERSYHASSEQVSSPNDTMSIISRLQKLEKLIIERRRRDMDDSPVSVHIWMSLYDWVCMRGCGWHPIIDSLQKAISDLVNTCKGLVVVCVNCDVAFHGGRGDLGTIANKVSEICKAAGALVTENDRLWRVAHALTGKNCKIPGSSNLQHFLLKRLLVEKSIDVVAPSNAFVQELEETCINEPDLRFNVPNNMEESKVKFEYKPTFTAQSKRKQERQEEGHGGQDAFGNTDVSDQRLRWYSVTELSGLICELCVREMQVNKSKVLGSNSKFNPTSCVNCCANWNADTNGIVRSTEGRQQYTRLFAEWVVTIPDLQNLMVDVNNVQAMTTIIRELAYSKLKKELSHVGFVSMTMDQAAQFYNNGHGKQLCASRDVIMCKNSEGVEERTSIFMIDKDLGNVAYSSWIKSVLDQGTMYDLLGQTSNEESLGDVVEMILGFFEVMSYFQHELPLWKDVWKIKREFEQSIVRHLAGNVSHTTG